MTRPDIRPDLLGIAEKDPNAITSPERAVLGWASMGAGLELGNAEVLRSGMGLAASGLRDIRTNPQYSEMDRRIFAIRSMKVLGSVKVDQLPKDDLETAAEFMRETLLTLAAGMKTPIQGRLDELRGEIIDGFTRLSTTVVLRDKTGASPVEQLKHLYEAPSDVLTEDQRRRMVVVRADDLFETGDNTEGVAILKFIEERDRVGFVDFTERQLRKAFKNASR